MSLPVAVERMALFLWGMACGAAIQWMFGPRGRLRASAAGLPDAPGGAAQSAARSAAQSALGRMHGLLGEIRGLMKARQGRGGDGGEAPR